MPTIHLTPTLKSGTVEFFSRIILNKRCAVCQKHVWIGYWKVFLHRARFEDGHQYVERIYSCCQGCAEEVTFVNATGHPLVIRFRGEKHGSDSLSLRQP